MLRSFVSPWLLHPWRLLHPLRLLRPLRLLAAATVAAAPLLTMSVAQGLAAAPGASQFTAAQRAEIVQIIRQALKSDPSILSDAILSLRADADRRQANDATAAIARNRTTLDGVAGDFITAGPASDVTLTEFYDPRCPYCRRMLPDLDALIARDHRIRLVEKLIPILGPESILEAQAIEAAGRQGRYWQLQHALMAEAGQPGVARIRSLARGVGVDVARLDRDIADPSLTALLRANLALSRSLGIDGTPSFVIGDTLIPGAVTLDQLRRLVAQARAG